MNILNKNKKLNKKPNLVPLINIVFLLLIFFMLSGTIAKKDFFHVEPPSSYTGADAESPELTILISDKNEISYDEVFISKIELKNILSNLKKTLNVEEVLIKADENSNAGNLSEVIKIIRSSGIERAAIVTKSHKN